MKETRKKLKKYINYNIKRNNIFLKLLSILKLIIFVPIDLITGKFKRKIKNYLFSDDCCVFDDINSSVDNYIEENKSKDFKSLLFYYIDERNLIDSDVYNKVHIDRRLFSKIKNDSTYHPSRETVILFSFALELNEREMDLLLQSASYFLSKTNTYDLIIRFCFINKIYNIAEVNELLDQYKCKLFNY